MRTWIVPRGVRHLRTYAELNSYFDDFVQGRYPFLWVVGRPGTTKTKSLCATARARDIYLHKGGQLTPAEFSIDCYRHRGKQVILYDIEHLLGNKVGAKLVTSLRDTSPEKLMSYGSTGREAVVATRTLRSQS